jgi:hypothetical protein
MEMECVRRAGEALPLPPGEKASGQFLMRSRSRFAFGCERMR